MGREVGGVVDRLQKVGHCRVGRRQCGRRGDSLAGSHHIFLPGCLCLPPNFFKPMFTSGPCPRVTLRSSHPFLILMFTHKTVR